ncbi:hypothetical protein HMPREF0201_02748 [Cedecea davisae DSM 4568]|uniref:Uncharacterized protein n=1 Tax=Cedecea davisae DSM 4568 TaxID=566551 RepID=S3IRG5_9ENTR|nr:hypothetical protein HMPREF0201_02748 [Cedecea davisae DSM 4568]
MARQLNLIIIRILISLTSRSRTFQQYSINNCLFHMKGIKNIPT